MRDGFGPVLLTVLMVVSIMLEMLTPSMGGFTIAAGALGIASTYYAFQQSATFGYFMTALNLALFPLTLWLSLRLISKSPLMHNTAINAGVQDAPDAKPLTHLLDQHGTTVTPLCPGGTALFGERKIDVITQGKFVEANAPIKVIHVEGNKVVVEAVQP